MENKEKKYSQIEAIVGAVIINEEGKIFLAKGTKWDGRYVIPGGHIEFGENAKEAIKREIKEELGINIKVIDRLGFGENVFSKSVRAMSRRHFVFMDFVCKYEGNFDDIKLNEEHDGGYGWFTLQKAKGLDLAGGSLDAIERYEKYIDLKNYLNGWKRCQADFENYKKQQVESQKDIIKYSTENIVTQILPVLDNFQAAMDHIPEKQEDGAWVQGITHIQKQLETVLADNGVEKIKVKAGDDFNPEIHEAIISDSNDANKHPNDSNRLRIKKVILKGYKIEDKIIRPARVIVK